ncbi:MAG: hypothetical protein KME22_22840 [Hassallia sp. WJT32-NPBG1]|jgi:hypothetical protein|nr:hypothetical protein [Hassallia sp. WJT32-NPBG1]
MSSSSDPIKAGHSAGSTISGIASGSIDVGKSIQIGDSLHNIDNKNELIQLSIPVEVARVLKWLAEKQNITPELALQKAIATEAFIYDITKIQEGQILFKSKDNTIGEITFK